MNARARFLAAIHCCAVDRPPVWLMRQAGRCLPEYRALKVKHDFVTMVRTPELAAEVTCQPVRRFGFDAAIVFSDILVIPEALGMHYRFAEGNGVTMQFRVRSVRDFSRLDPVAAVADRLQYVADAIRIVRRELPANALLGFSGSPWTLAHYMVEGGGGGINADCGGLKMLRHTHPALFAKLMDRITRAVIAYGRLQAQAGVDAIQIFDSFGGALAASDYEAASGRWMRRIVTALNKFVPVIVFARGAHGSLTSLSATGADVIGLDATADLADCARRLPRQTAVQGNLDPALLLTDPRTVRRATRALISSLDGRRGHIVNLGHGVPPAARLDCIEALVDTVHGIKNEK